MKIEKIIHQVWEGRIDPTPPIRLQLLAETWKKHNPDWEYRLWSGKEMEELVSTHFPHLIDLYQTMPHNVQRWDIIRYMILYVYGGVYTDLDTECFKSITPLLKGKTLCFGAEPPEHWTFEKQGSYDFIGNAFLASSRKNEGWLHLLRMIEFTIKEKRIPKNIGSFETVLYTTGPLIITKNMPYLINVYNASILPYFAVSPLSKANVIKYITGEDLSTFKQKIKGAYCAHYFFGSWEPTEFNVYKTKV